MHIVLVHPDIPGNAGNIARTCVATGTTLHFVRPMGFEISDRHLKRAGLDYWENLTWEEHASIGAMESAVMAGRPCFLFTKTAARSIWETEFAPDSVLIFGSETQGLPTQFMEKYPERLRSIPMTGPVRSLNVSTAAGIVLYEALRQTR